MILVFIFITEIQIKCHKQNIRVNFNLECGSAPEGCFFKIYMQDVDVYLAEFILIYPITCFSLWYGVFSVSIMV